MIETAKLMRRVDPPIMIVAVGKDYRARDWSPQVLKVAGRFIDFISMHQYYIEDDYSIISAAPLDLERKLIWLGSVIDAYTTYPKGRIVNIALDEWNVVHRTSPEHLGFTQRTTLGDAIFTAGVYHVLHRLCNRVKVATMSSLINIIGVMYTNDDGGLYVTPQYHVCKLYSNMCNEVAVKSRIEHTAEYKVQKLDLDNVGYLDCSATLAEDGKQLSISVINRHATNQIDCEISIRGFSHSQKMKAYEINGQDVNVANDFDHKDNVKTSMKILKNQANTISYQFPPHSVTLLALNHK